MNGKDRYYDLFHGIEKKTFEPRGIVPDTRGVGWPTACIQK